MKTVIQRFLPILRWIPGYQRQDLLSDLIAGIIVAIMLVPQGMAYALLAGLPPQSGLYASILPAILYGLLGTSRSLAVGPVALTSILVAASVGGMAPQNGAEYLLLAVTLALMVGTIQLILGFVGLGRLVNFISHPVLTAFTSAAAIIIGVSQLKFLLGIQLPRLEHLHENLLAIYQNLNSSNWITLFIGFGSILLLVFFRPGLNYLLSSVNIPEAIKLPLTKTGAMVVVGISILLVWGFQLDSRFSVETVGQIPAGLPQLTLPSIDPGTWRSLAGPALTISVIAFLESISVAKSLAAKNRDPIDANQELIGLGAANLGAAFTGGYPVAGGFARSVVNFTVGAKSGLASITTAIVVGFTLIFMMPLFYFLPKAVLAAIILVAVSRLIDFHAFRQVWIYSRTDSLSWIVTFLAVLILGIDIGILIGIGTALVVYLWKTSRPHIALVGRVGQSEHYRNTLRHTVHTCSHVAAVRIDESLYFANIQYLQDYLLNMLTQNPSVKHVVLICSAVNEIDASALHQLENLLITLQNARVNLYLAEVKGPVMDKLKHIGFTDRIQEERIFLSTHQAMHALGCA